MAYQHTVLSHQLVQSVAEIYGTPTFVYSESVLRESARDALNFPAPYGITVRYAMKANPNKTILKIFDAQGLHIDASSIYEVQRAALAGISPSKIMLTTQEFPDEKVLLDFVSQGMQFNACSLHQLEKFGTLFGGAPISVRINPGTGSGGSPKTNVGGSTSSFGIWHESLDKANRIIDSYKLRVQKIHTHIGSGSDPEIWNNAAAQSMQYLHKFPSAEILNLGGGFKVARTSEEKETDFGEIGAPVSAQLEAFYEATGRKIHLEIEPGTKLVAHAGSLVAKIVDIKKTDRYTFLVVDTGMTEILRPTLYGAVHPLQVVQKNPSNEQGEYVVVGHCCESGDILTPQQGNSNVLDTRLLAAASIGDCLVIGKTGAYCAAMSAKNYNSFPESAEVLQRSDGTTVLIRERQTLEQMLKNEFVPTEKHRLQKI